MARVIDDIKNANGEWLKSLSIGGITYFTRAGQKWRAMMDRCQTPEESTTRNRVYSECSVSANFNDFNYFADWCQQQIGYKDGYELDKDLLVKGNKRYCESCCVFLPPQLNKLLLRSQAIRGELPVGVVYRKDTDKYRYQLSIGTSRFKSGGYRSSEEAFDAYKVAKEKYIQLVAASWRSQIDPRAYEALMNYTVEITD